MAGDSPSLKQEDIEELLRQAQMASGVVPEGASSAEAATAAAPPTSSPPVEAQPARPAPPTATATNEPELPRPILRHSADQALGDDVQFLLAQAEQAIASVASPVEPPVTGLAPFELKDLSGAPASGEKATLELLKDVDLNLRI